MRYTKIALLTFGAGLLLGLVVVVAEIDWLGRVASSLMALGVAALPLGVIVDWRLAAKTARPSPNGRRKTARPRAAQRPGAARSRKPARPKR